ncbi:contractile injection system tape measure protein [Chitinophaga japonensis]|uniref:Uncharacterized protein n=1 Tax=Chitinophaga japonensis TaxID=104662 RepID=A0A562STI6_CHIJA|nr:contractile injection system tape measure protein [Chitinophaga japonensis]TWI84522.1 hypothetical protein LX66_4892 [Chitinophaga japonensis]
MNTIRRYTFDVQFSSRQRAAALQDRISSLFRQRIAADTGHLLQQLVPGDVVAVLDTLELDLGTILYKDLDTALPDLVMEALAKALEGILRNGHPGQQHVLTGRVQVKTGHDRWLELLGYYLLTGVLPWWATEAERQRPDSALQFLAAHAPARLAAFLRQVAQQAYVRRRIAFQFSIAAIREAVTVLEPAEAAFIFEYTREVLQVQVAQQVMQTTAGALERAVWLFVLTYLVTQTGSNFSRKQFVRSQLMQMAHYFNTSYEALLQLFYDALAFYAQDIPEATVGGFIKALYVESAATRGGAGLRRHRNAYTAADAAAGEEAGTPAGQVALLRYYLLYGSLPGWAAAWSLTGLYERLMAAAQQAPAALKEMLAVVLQQEPARRRWQAVFNTAQQEAVFRTLAGSTPAGAGETDLFLTRLAAFKKDGPQDVGHVLLRDVILYRLFYGSVPWWGRTYAHFSLNSLLQQLLEQDMPQAVLLFKYAGTVPYAMERFLYGVEPPVFFQAARAAGLPDLAYEAYESMDALLQTMLARMAGGLPARLLQKLLLQAYWQVWAQTGYGHFDTEDFTVLTVRWWAEAAGMAPAGLLFAIKNILPGITEADIQQQVAARLQQLLADWQAEGAELYYAIPPDGKAATPQAAHALLRWVRRNIAPGTAAEKENAGRIMDTWLRHFLETGSLPQEAGTFSEREAAWLAGRILEWLYVNYRERLAVVPSWIQPLPGILNRLFFLWQATGTAPVPLRELLQAWIEQALALPAAGTMVVKDGLWQEITEQRTPSATPLRDTLPAAASRLLHRFRQYDALTGAAEKQQWLEQAGSLLAHFLAWQQLPAELGMLSPAAVQELLKQAAVLLFRESPATLLALFGSGSSLLSARLEVYNLFATPAGIPETSIRQALQAYAVQDSLLLLQETGSHSFNGPVAGFREAVRFYKQQSRHERQAFYKRIFRHAILVQYAAQELDDAAFLDMMQDISIGWGHPAPAALHELQQLFGLVITDSLEREKIALLFRQFHIMLLAGQLALYNAAEYAARFLEFLAGAGVAGAERFIGRLAAINGKVNLSSYTHLRNILPALQQQAARYVQTHLHMESIRSSLYEQERELLHPATDTAKPATMAAPPPAGKELAPLQPAEKERQPLKKPELETVYVDNAGLVLLHPFLTTAFQRLGWIQAGRFISIEAQHRAVHLLQYTVNGEEVHPEHGLALNKILCNLPLEEPVPAEIALTEDEKRLSHEMLQVVLQQWEKMQHTSPEGFRGAFLQREGALWQTDEAWFLRVEQRGYDVIMQTLPWSVAMIKTSWMEKILYTEWIYA